MLSYLAGFSQGCEFDASRQNWDATGPRPLSWCAWYPVETDHPTIEQKIGARSREIFTNGPVATNAPLSASKHKYPLVMLSHGTGGSALSLGWLGSRLARAGCIAVGLNHHGNTAIEPYRGEGFMCWWERMTDISRLLDWLLDASPLAGSIVPEEIYASGMSLGGYTVLGLMGARTDMDLFLAWAETQEGPIAPPEFPDLQDEYQRLLTSSGIFKASLERHTADYSDQRIRAALALCPAPTIRGFTPESLAAIDRPVSLLCGDEDREAPAQETVLWLKDHNPAFRTEILTGGVGHYCFLSEATETGLKEAPQLCLDARGIDRKAIHDHATRRATELFATSKPELTSHRS